MRVLVATDGSRGGTAALGFAVRLAGNNPSTRLIVVTIGIDGSVPFHRPDGGPNFTDEGRSAREANLMKADLVVVGSEGRDTLREWVVGGVALRLIYLARRPVTVVRPPRQRRGPEE